MLKFEKKSGYHDQINIIIRNKEYWLTPALRTGLMIAIAFHLVFITIFHIVPFQFPENSFVFPPVMIEVPSSKQISLSAIDERLEQVISMLPPRIATAPEIGAFPKFELIYPVEKPHEQPIDAFIQIEHEIITPDWTFNQEIPTFSIQWKISGPLANQSLLHFPNNDLKIKVDTTYHVMVESRTGKIFWVENLQKISDFSAIEWLESFQFETDSETFVTEGIIEVLKSNNGIL